MVVEQEHTNSGGTLHGGLICTFTDGVTNLAQMTESGGVPGVSVDMHLSFMGAAKVGDKITIDAKTKRAGRSMTFVDVQITNCASGKLIATGSHTMTVGNNVGNFKYENSQQ
ncbi:acyl-coenzyme A thioesterase 13-like isoform X2 [Neocloeon triangulifer]|nr:acyl-coenzyme A thioesterase 13-like isoform X2 [Neocloeon triangulifer]XP_059478060.1 acyl-coenzyme A thioesterase 13-like isoform X2 [Neocloeon triangulifer]